MVSLSSHRSDVSVIKYQVVCKQSSCEAEDLSAPTKATLDESLAHVGKTLHAVMEPLEDEGGTVRRFNFMYLG